MKKIYSSLSLVLVCFLSHAQYHAAIGGRLAKFNSGITMSYFTGTDNASGISLLIAHSKISEGGWVISPLYVCQRSLHVPIIQLPLNFIGGGGIHVGYYPT